MAKRKAAKKKSTAASQRPTLSKSRSQIDRLDREILKLINQRAKISCDIGQLKQDEGRPSFDPQRESEILDNLGDLSKGPLDRTAIKSIYREIISHSRALRIPLRAAYLGPSFSYSHLAAIERFGQGSDLIPVATIAAVFEEVDSGQAEFGVVPIENSTDGRIVDTLHRFTQVPVRICGEVQLRIHHHLLGKCSRAEIQEVCSKPQALSQCRDWLAKHLPQANVVEMTSTTAAAELAAEKPGVAAIASRQAAVNYSLEVIAAEIEDNKDNVTRFAVISQKTSPRTGNDKTSLMFHIDHKPGGLAEAMGVFKRNRLNLTWIESFPMPGKVSEYLFFVELEGHQSDLKVKRAIASLVRKSVRLEILGSYQRTTPVE